MSFNSNQTKPNSSNSQHITRRTLLERSSMIFGGLLSFPFDVNATNIKLDPIWGPNGAAEQIVQALRSVSQSTFPNREFSVLEFGAKNCKVVGSKNPYTDVSRSPSSAGAELTHAPGSFDSRPAFLAAIRACNKAGGGRVVVPPGDWYCAGPIVLLSDVNFHLSSNCTIYFSQNPSDYAKDGPFDCKTNGKLFFTRWESNDCLNFGSPIYAFKQNNIAITGEDESSILNGQAMTPFAGSGNGSTCWWTYKGNLSVYGVSGSATPSQAFSNPGNVDLKSRLPNIDPSLYATLTNPVTPWQEDRNYLPALSEAGVPAIERVFGLGHFLRPCMIEFIQCTNVLMENYQLRNSPFWQHHPVGCKNVVIRGVLMDSIGPNNDGFDPDACDTVLCENNVFNTGDDCIAIKSGKNRDSHYGPARNHLIQNCTMNSGHGGLTLGSEMGAGIEKVYARNLKMLNQNWKTDPLNIAIRIKTNMNRGGYVKDFYVDNVTLPHGVSMTGEGYKGTMLTGSPINSSVPIGVTTRSSSNPAAAQGGVIVFDCDYQPSKDAMRTRPALVKNVNISNIKVNNVTLNGRTASCFQAIIAQGPVSFDYNGPQPAPLTFAISGVTISDSDFGTPSAVGPASADVPGPIYAYNVKDIVLKNVKIGGEILNQTLTDLR